MKRIRTCLPWYLWLICVIAFTTFVFLSMRKVPEKFSVCITRPTQQSTPTKNKKKNERRQGPTDVGNPYRGLYGQTLKISLVADSYYYLSKDNSRDTLYFWATDQNALHLIIEPASTGISASDRVQIGHKVYFKDKQSGHYIYARPSDSKIILSPDQKTGFTIESKYSGCPNIEYEENINNRNINCDFPYYDCFARCARRKLVADNGLMMIRTPGDSENKKYDAYLGNGDWRLWMVALVSW